MAWKRKINALIGQYLGDHLDWVRFVAVVVVLLVCVGAVTMLFSSKAEAGEWRSPEYLIAFGNFKGNTLARPGFGNANPGGIFQLQHGYQFHRNFAAVYGYLHISSVPLESGENHHDAFYVGFHGTFK